MRQSGAQKGVACDNLVLLSSLHMPLASGSGHELRAEEKVEWGRKSEGGGEAGEEGKNKPKRGRASGRGGEEARRHPLRDKRGLLDPEREAGRLEAD